MYNGLLKSFLITLATFVAVFLLFAPSWSADWEISPYVEIIEEYNDNIRFSSTGEELVDDFVTYVRPRVEAKYNTDKLRMSLNSSLGVEKYVDYDELDTIDHDHKLALSYGLSRTLGLRTGGYFREDTTLETELIEEGLLVDREDRQKFGGSFGFNYALSTFLSCSADWTRRYIEYPDNPDDSDDQVGDTLKLTPMYVLSPQTSLFLNLTYTNTEYDDEEDTSIASYNIIPSFRHDFGEAFYVSVGAGYRYTEYETKNTDEHTYGFVFNFLFHRNWERVSMKLLASRNQYPTADRRSVERNMLTLKGTYRLSDRLRSSLAATFRTNRVDKGTGDSDYYTVSPAFSYDLTSTITLKGSVDYTEYDYKDINDAARERFRARLFLNFTWPRLWRG
ncbi:MAG: outer membrane beta-barrel protein [Desulfobacterales bacterium]|nr:outer membrane beta-barrel protein [Desulfobacterales bacterium]